MSSCYPRLTGTILVAIFMCLSGQALSDEPLTWEACVREASERNASLISSKESVAKSEAQVSSAYGPFLPQLTGSAGYTQSGSGGGNALPDANGNLGSSQGQYSLGINTTINVFNGFQDSSKLDQFKAGLEGSHAGLKSQKAALHQELKKAFAQLLYAQTALSLSQEIEKRRKDNFDLVEMRFQGGRENKGSLLRSKASYGQARFEVAQGRRNLRVAQRQLARLLGRDVLSPITVKGDLATKTPPREDLNFRELARETPSVLQSTSDLKGASAGVSKAYGAFYPALSLNGSVSRVGESFPPDSNRWSAGVTLSIPIFQWGNLAEVSVAKAEERRAEVGIRNAEEQAAVRLEETFALLTSAIERVGVQEETLSAASVRSELARAQYTSGLATYNDWDIIENDLINQQQNLLNLKRDAVIAEASWEQALGKGDL